MSRPPTRLELGFSAWPTGCSPISGGDLDARPSSWREPPGHAAICPYSAENEWSNALGVGPFAGSYFRFQVEDGEIREVVNFFAYSLYSWEAFESFLAWVETNHPQAYEGMRSASGEAILTPESISLWERYTDEFVAYVESGGR